MRESNERWGSAERQAGKETGARWAKTEAEAIELRRLAEAVEAEDGVHNALAAPGERVAAVFFNTVFPGEDSRVDRGGFWRGWADDDGRLSDEYVEGFAEGALEVWDAVEDKL